MVDTYRFTRSNYFRVKDKDEFRRLCLRYGLELITDEEDESLVGFYTFDDWPTYRWDAMRGDIVDMDIVDDIAECLEEGCVAIIMEAGYEKARYGYGHAIAVNSKGETRSVDLKEIYTRAQELGENITSAEY